MAEITVVTSPNGNGWTCTVQVAEGNGQTRHSVTVSRDAYEQLRAGKSATPEHLVRKSFEFLLEREPKHHILRQFELEGISRFFPEYPAEIGKRL